MERVACRTIYRSSQRDALASALLEIDGDADRTTVKPYRTTESPKPLMRDRRAAVQPSALVADDGSPGRARVLARADADESTA